MANNDQQNGGGYNDKDANDKELAHEPMDDNKTPESSPDDENSLSMDDGTTRNSSKNKPISNGNGGKGKNDDIKQNDQQKKPPQQNEVDKIIAKLRSLKRSVNRGCISYVHINIYIMHVLI